MSSLSADRKPPVDYGVQIRFIKDLHDTGGGYPVGPRGSSRTGPNAPSSKYGVAVRVQGIAGQPYVVLKEGEKGDSYGVQLKSEPRNSSSTPAFSSLPRKKADPDPQNPYPQSGEASSLGRAKSQDSLLDKEVQKDFGGQLMRPPGDGRSGSCGTLHGGEKEEAGGPPSIASNGPEKKEGGLYPGVLIGGEESPCLNESFPDPPPPVEEDLTPAVDTQSLTPINRLISKFDGGGSGGPAKGRSRARPRPKIEEAKRASSLDIRDSASEASLPPPPPSPTPNPYSSTPPSSASSCSSLGRSSGSVAKVMALPLASTPPSSWSAGRAVARDTAPITQAEKQVNDQVTPDLLRDQGQNAEVATKEDQIKQAIYNILKEGTNEKESATKRKVDLVFEKIQGLGSTNQTMKAELEECLDENLRLQEQLDQKNTELHQAYTELTQLRMEREVAESRGRMLEDQLAEQQEELRRVAEDRPQTDSLQTELMSAQAELSEAAMLQQRLEETLRQRERELTALKGALKDEVSSHDQEMEALREQYSQDMERLRKSMEQVSQSQQGIESERQRVNATMLSLTKELEDCKDEGGHLREQLDSTREELSSTKEELLQARLEKEEFEEELKELQEQLYAMKEQIPDPSHTQTLTKDLNQCRDSLKMARSDLEQLKVELEKKGAELNSLKKANQDREAEHKQEIEKLRAQSQKDKEELAKALEKAKQAAPVEQREAGWEVERLKDRLAGAQRELQAQKNEQQELQETNARLRDKIARLEARLQSSTSQSSEAELALEEENRGLRTQLEESRRGAVRLGQERDELSRRLEERDREKEGLRRGKTELEEQKRLLDRAVEKLTKEMEQLSSEARQSVQALQAQLEDYRERSRRELQEAQRQGKERLAELQRSQGTARSLQEEVSRLKKELLLCSEQRDSAQLEKELLANRLKHTEEELDTERGTHSDRSREIRALEDQVKQMEIELDEEKTNTELLSDRITRSREQIDQLRSELMQERSSRQDVELDKGVLERQLKELRLRVADMEGQSRPSPGLPQLENKVQELEERLHSEEREKSSMQAAQRRLERKLKELNITLEEERQRHSEQRDQLSLRVKALKRQVDEGEGEVERLEGLRRKALREAEEQLELKEVLQARVTALEAELKRRIQQSRRPTVSSEDEEALDDVSSIASMLSERHLQTSTC